MAWPLCDCSKVSPPQPHCPQHPPQAGVPIEGAESGRLLDLETVRQTPVQKVDAEFAGDSLLDEPWFRAPPQGLVWPHV